MIIELPFLAIQKVLFSLWIAIFGNGWIAIFDTDV